MSAPFLLLCAALLGQQPALLSTGSATTGLPTTKLPDGLGVNIHFTTPSEGELERLVEAGYRWVRTDLTWASVEKTAGQYDFRAYDHLVDTLGRANIRVLFILDYANPLYDKGEAPHTDDGRAAFARFAAAAAGHYADRKVLWEIWNEPNLSQFWKREPNGGLYARLAIEAARAMRRSDSHATIIGPGTSGFPWGFLEEAFQQGLLNELDAISVHPYRETGPETVVNDYGKLRALIARYATADRRQLPIVSSEWGYSTAAGRWTEAEQASMLARQWLVNISQGVNLSIFYDWKDDGSDPAENEHRFGTVQQDLTPKPSFEAARQLISQLLGYQFRHRLFPESDNGDSGSWKLLFQKGDHDEYMLVSWTAPRNGRTDELPTFEPIGQGHKLLEPMRTLAAVRVPPGPIAQFADDPEHLPIQIVTHDGKPVEILGETSQGAPPKLYQFDGPTTGAVGLPLTSQSVRSDRQTVTVKWGEKDRPSGYSTQFHLWRADPLLLWVVPEQSAVRVLVQNPARGEFDGSLQVVAQSTGASLTQQPVAFKAGDDVASMRIARTTGILEYFVVDKSRARVTSPVVLRLEPFEGFPGAPSERSGWSSVLHVDNAGQPRRALRSIRLERGSPAAVGMEVGYQFDPGWRFLTVEPDATALIPKDAEALSLWCRGDLHGDTLRCRLLDSTGQTFQIDFPAQVRANWNPIRIPLDAAAASSHWGGANDGVPHPPLSWGALLVIDSAERDQAHSGGLQIAAPFYLLRP